MAEPLKNYFGPEVPARPKVFTLKGARARATRVRATREDDLARPAHHPHALSRAPPCGGSGEWPTERGPGIPRRRNPRFVISWSQWLPHGRENAPPSPSGFVAGPKVECTTWVAVTLPLPDSAGPGLRHRVVTDRRHHAAQGDHPRRCLPSCEHSPEQAPLAFCLVSHGHPPSVSYRSAVGGPSMATRDVVGLRDKP